MLATKDTPQVPSTLALIRMVNRNFKKDTGDTPINSGYRFRQSARAKEEGPDVIELGLTYFYEHDVDLYHPVDAMAKYTAVGGWDITFEIIPGSERWERKNWPGDSWRTALYRITSVVKVTW